MNEELKTFECPNSVINEEIAKVIGFKAEAAGYTEDMTHYVFWYKPEDFNKVYEKWDEIQKVVEEYEEKDIAMAMSEKCPWNPEYCSLLIDIVQ